MRVCGPHSGECDYGQVATNCRRCHMNEPSSLLERLSEEAVWRLEEARRSKHPTRNQNKTPPHRENPSTQRGAPPLSPPIPAWSRKTITRRKPTPPGGLVPRRPLLTLERRGDRAAPAIIL